MPHNTVNLPQEATMEEVKKVFRIAHQLKCKGITVYSMEANRSKFST
ncbi:MAG: hypothetical protein ACOC6H_03355 [Thermoproteota archaeon]